MAERPHAIPQSAIGRSTPIRGGEAYARVRRTVHSTVTSPFRAKISDQVRDNKRLLADGMITLAEYKSRKRDIVAMLREKRRRKQWEEDDKTAALETASVATAPTLGSGGPSLGSALPSAYTESIASSHDGGRQNNNPSGNASSQGADRKKEKDSSGKKKKTKKKKNKRRRSLGRGMEPSTASRFNYNQPLDDSGSAHTNIRGSRKRSAHGNGHRFHNSGRSDHDIEPRRGSAIVLEDEKSLQSRDVQWRRKTKHAVHGKENKRDKLDSVEKQQRRRDNVLDDTVVHSSDKAMRGLSPRALQRMSQTSGSIDRDRPLFDMGRQFHGNMALELELLRAENRKLRRDLQTRTQQVISLERQLVQAQRVASSSRQQRQAAEQSHRRAPGPGSVGSLDTSSTPVGAEAAAAIDKSDAAHAGAQMDSPRAMRRLLNSFKATISKLKDDNDQLKVKLMRSTTKTEKNDEGTKKKKKKKKKGRRDRVGAGLSADASALRMLLGIPSASLETIDLTPGAALGCIMEEFTSNGISVIRVHQLLPTAQAGIRVGDIVASVNDKSTVGNDMDHFAQMINPQQHSKRQLKLLRPEGQADTNGGSNDNDGATGSVASFGQPGTASVASFGHHGTASVASRETAHAAAEEQKSEAPMLVECPQCKTELRVPLGGERTGFRCGRCNSALSMASVKQQLEEHKLRGSLKSSLSSGAPTGKSKKTVAFGRHVVHI